MALPEPKQDCIETAGKNFKVSLSDQAEVVVGDENAIGFKPHVRIKRWGEETHFAFGLQTAKNITPDFDGEKVIWTDGDQQLHCYGLNSDADQFDKGGIEFALWLGVKPASNVFTFDADLRGLTAFYQPELDAWEVERGNTRPDNVVGSYAFYHGTRGQMHASDADGAKYMAGKAFHLYRPKAVDARGNECWGKLSYDQEGSKLTVTIDPTWLSLATYPVIVDPDVGYTTLGASLDSTNDYLLANLFTAPSAGTANPGTASVGIVTNSGTNTVMFGAYTGGGTNPATKSRLATSSPITGTTTKAFRSAAITWTGILATDYWLSLNNSATGGGQSAYDAGLTASYAPRTHANDMPDPWPTREGTQTSKVSMYVTYTASAATRNTRSHPLGVNLGMYRRMPT